MSGKSVQIIGAGLCGSLLAIMLARRGKEVVVYERGSDPRTGEAPVGRSINLAMAARGIRALKRADAFDRVEPLLMPMTGRLIHHEDGSTELQPYGQRVGEQIYSVSRVELNRVLIEEALATKNVTIRFGHETVGFYPEEHVLRMRDHAEGKDFDVRARPAIAADGAGSVIRRAYDGSDRICPTEDLLEHGYKELEIPPGPGGEFQLDPGALHVWPRGGFMLIALPNPEGDFTLTLFLAHDGDVSFASLDTDDSVVDFFTRHFGDAVPLIPDLPASFRRNPVGVLGTVRCKHWHDGDRMLLIGDAAHAVVPFHGQGMNLAFEDCAVVDEILGERDYGWLDVFAKFELAQIANADAIADMALENYVEMRDTVRDRRYVLQKALSFELERRLPRRFIPRYSMVMFHDEIPYAVARQRGAVQQALLEEFTQDVDSVEQIDLNAAEAAAVARLEAL